MTMRTKTIRTALAAICAVAAMSANARSLIHYFDFDTLRNGSLAYAGVDKGTRPADFTFKNNGSASLGYTTGALGSDHAFYSSNKSSIWLGDGSPRSAVARPRALPSRSGASLLLRTKNGRTSSVSASAA